MNNIYIHTQIILLCSYIPCLALIIEPSQRDRLGFVQVKISLLIVTASSLPPKRNVYIHIRKNVTFLLLWLMLYTLESLITCYMSPTPIQWNFRSLPLLNYLPHGAANYMIQKTKTKTNSLFLSSKCPSVKMASSDQEPESTP